MRFRALWPIEVVRCSNLLFAEAQDDLARVLAEHELAERDIKGLRWSVEGGHVCLIADMEDGMGEKRLRNCGHCGIAGERRGSLCQDCLYVPESTPVAEPVRWVRRGMVWRAA